MDIYIYTICQLLYHAKFAKLFIYNINYCKYAQVLFVKCQQDVYACVNVRIQFF